VRSRSVQYSALVSGHGVAPSVPLPTARPVSERSSTPAPLRSHPREHFAPTLTADGRSASSAPAGVHAGIVRRCPTRATTSSVQPLDALSGTEINGQVDTVSIGEGSPTRLAIVSIPSLTTLRNRMNLEAVALTQESWLSGSNSECSGTNPSLASLGQVRRHRALGLRRRSANVASGTESRGGEPPLSTFVNGNVVNAEHVTAVRNPSGRRDSPLGDSAC